jgi:hypothetical protein
MGSKKFFNLYFICGIGALLFKWQYKRYEVHAITGSFTIAHPARYQHHILIMAMAQNYLYLSMCQLWAHLVPYLDY